MRSESWPQAARLPRGRASYADDHVVGLTSVPTRDMPASEQGLQVDEEVALGHSLDL
jgi:hypothetical protein